MFKRSIFLLAIAIAMANLAQADRYDDLINKWQDHGIGGYEGSDAMDLAWRTVPRLRSLCYGYMLKKDKALMDKCQTAVDRWVNVTPMKNPAGQLGYLVGGAGGTEQPGESFRIIGAILHYIYLVYNNSDLSTHKTKAVGYLDKMENVIIKKWLDHYYINDDKQPPGSYHYPGTGAAIYPCFDGQCLPDGTGNMASMSAQHNKNSDFGSAMLWLYKITNNAKYKKIVEEVALNFKSKLIWQDGGRFYSWHYWDPTWAMDFATNQIGIGQIKNSDRRWIEHRGGYGAINMEFVTECYRHGIVYTRQDIERFVITNRDIMYNGGNWTLNDGSKPGEGGMYTALCTYDEKGLLADLGFNTYNASYSGWSGMGLPYYAYTMKLTALDKYPAPQNWKGPLEAVKVEGLDRSTVKVTFFNKVDPVSAGKLTNYKLSRGTVINSVSVAPDNMSVTLSTVEQLPDYGYKVTAYDVYDIYRNKTFAFGNTQPWLYTSSSQTAGIAPSVKMEQGGLISIRGTREIRDLQGKKVTLSPGHAILQPGVYIYSVGDGSEIKYGKLVVTQ
jgi:hypothetical protein